MSSETIITQVREGMKVHTADGQILGTVTRVWFGSDPSASSPRCDDDICSRIEVQSGRMLRRRMRYVPYSAIAAIADGRVTLNVDAATVDERNWMHKPQWITAVTASADAKNEKIRDMTIANG